MRGDIDNDRGSDHIDNAKRRWQLARAVVYHRIDYVATIVYFAFTAMIPTSISQRRLSR